MSGQRDTKLVSRFPLSTKSRNGLFHFFGRGVLEKPKVIALAGMDRMRLAVGLGPASLREIALALYKLKLVSVEKPDDFHAIFQKINACR